MEALTQWFGYRYPLLADITVGEDGGGSVRIPPIVGLISAVAEAERASYCIVLPRRGELARIASVAIAITSLKRDYSTLAASSEAPVGEGECVRVHPGRGVYRFGGVSRDYPEQFWLICKDGSRRTFPRSQAFRLQRSPGARITGSGSQPLISVPKHPVDLLLGLESYGNLSNIPNALLLLDVQTRYWEFADRTWLARSSNSRHFNLIDLGILGQVEDDGTLTALNGQKGFPVMAVTSSIDSIVNAVGRAARIPTVVLNGLVHLKSPQHFDSLADRARVIAFAEHSEYALVNDLRARGCKIWPIGTSELLVDPVAARSSVSAGPLGDIVIAACNSDAELLQVQAANEALEQASLELQSLGKSLGDSEEGRRFLIGPLFGLLLRTASVVGELTAAERLEWSSSAKTIRGELARLRHWMTGQDAERVSKACDQLELALAPDAGLGVQKREQLLSLLETLKRDGTGRVAVVARRGATGDQIRMLARGAGLDVEVFTGDPASIPDKFFEALIVTTWIGSAKFKKVFQAYLARRIFMLGYPFELRWFAQCLTSIKRDASGSEMSGSERAKLIGVDSGLPLQWTGAKEPEVPIYTKVGESFFDIERTFSGLRRGSGISQSDAEEKIAAKYVEFAGDRFAYLSEGHLLPIATQLVVGESRASTKLPERDVSEWLVGDYIVFLEGGGAQVIKEIADRMLGARAIQLRQTAMQWRTALISTGLPATEIQRRLKDEGCVRTLATIRGWLSSSSQIGPEEKSDLQAISRVTATLGLAVDIEAVWASIHELWSAHLSAGTVLRRILVQKLPPLVDELEEAGTEIAIEDGGKHLGRALIVKVELIAEDFEQCSRSLVNRLRVAGGTDVVSGSLHVAKESEFEKATSLIANLSEADRAELLKKLEAL